MMDDIPEKEIFALICRQQGLNFPEWNMHIATPDTF
ncbi:hypothetical protein OKW21_003375 [Catalinimonas alkaloidigena]|nr:hypothetical protein [Catalinimonas alkaloidigena]